jgi:hypothetical protein
MEPRCVGDSGRQFAPSLVGATLEETTAEG